MRLGISSIAVAQREYIWSLKRRSAISQRPRTLEPGSNKYVPEVYYHCCPRQYVGRAAGSQNKGTVCPVNSHLEVINENHTAARSIAYPWPIIYLRFTNFKLNLRLEGYYTGEVCTESRGRILLSCMGVK